ncbi:MAG TPA: hypothetical protein VIF37_09200 [Methylobacter sp.]|jgi:hypothetical protein
MSLNTKALIFYDLHDTESKLLHNCDLDNPDYASGVIIKALWFKVKRLNREKDQSDGFSLIPPESSVAMIKQRV